MRDHPSHSLSVPSALDALDLRELALEIAAIPQADRVKLAMLLVRDIDQASCIWPLRRLADQAMGVSAMLAHHHSQKEYG